MYSLHYRVSIDAVLGKHHCWIHEHLGMTIMVLNSRVLFLAGFPIKPGIVLFLNLKQSDFSFIYCVCFEVNPLFHDCHSEVKLEKAFSFRLTMEHYFYGLNTDYFLHLYWMFLFFQHLPHSKFTQHFSYFQMMSGVLAEDSSLELQKNFSTIVYLHRVVYLQKIQYPVGYRRTLEFSDEL